MFSADIRTTDNTIIADICKMSTPGILTAEQLEIPTKTLTEITQRILTEWLTTLNNETESYPYQKHILTLHLENKDKKLTEITAKQIYSRTLMLKPAPPKKYLKWYIKLPHGHTPIMQRGLEKKFQKLRHRNMYNKANEIQYKYIHRKLPSLHLIHKWNENIDDKCKRCNKQETETLQH